jgi:hypothetical protein
MDKSEAPVDNGNTPPPLLPYEAGAAPSGRIGEGHFPLGARLSFEHSLIGNGGVSKRIWRAWFVVAIGWSTFWMWLYIISRGSSQGQFERRVATTLMMALPWMGGWLMYWVLPSGRDS